MLSEEKEIVVWSYSQKGMPSATDYGRGNRREKRKRKNKSSNFK